VPLKFRERLQFANRPAKDVYFLESGLGSVVAIGRGGRRQAEVGVIGREGMTGLPIVLGAERSPCEIFMQVEGSGQSIDAAHLSKAMHQSVTMALCFQRFAHVFAMQASYTALANAQGTIDSRLARWLLMAHDRLGSDVLKLTHEFLALMLGVRRADVTTALGRFEDICSRKRLRSRCSKRKPWLRPTSSLLGNNSNQRLTVLVSRSSARLVGSASFACFFFMATALRSRAAMTPPCAAAAQSPFSTAAMARTKLTPAALSVDELSLAAARTSQVMFLNQTCAFSEGGTAQQGRVSPSCRRPIQRWRRT